MFETLVADFDVYNFEGLCSGKAYMRKLSPITKTVKNKFPPIFKIQIK